MLVLVIVGPGSHPTIRRRSRAVAYKPPSLQFWLGTDQCGRDILSRLLYGARATVLMAIIASALGTLAGALIGTTSAYLGGRSDEAIMRTIDAVMSIPSLLMALLIVTLLGKSSFNALLAIGIAFTPGMARVTRSVALTVRKQELRQRRDRARREGPLHRLARDAAQRRGAHRRGDDHPRRVRRDAVRDAELAWARSRRRRVGADGVRVAALRISRPG
jgi:hypothetical protein